ncbi:hypothetical protein RRG08_038656 [Elysia crispata]|uniref:Uncharacterized protein n=1 Tax=Elysia crispata TaxID=231223 RepID=A0AAE1AI35_9GAST|nr:hypothetical protein RRG08_038656 [Elysia crispata]
MHLLAITVGFEFFHLCRSLVKTYLENNYLGGSTDVDVERMRDEILYGALNGSDVETGTLWFSKMTKFLNVLKLSRHCSASLGWGLSTRLETWGSSTRVADRMKKDQICVGLSLLVAGAHILWRAIDRDSGLASPDAVNGLQGGGGEHDGRPDQSLPCVMVVALILSRLSS